jgi:hypothetical protein
MIYTFGMERKPRSSHESMYRGPIRRDFLGESHLIKGQWVRQRFYLSVQEDAVYTAFGRLFRRIRDEANKDYGPENKPQ